MFTVLFYRDGEWLGIKSFIETEAEAREIVESWLVENTNRGYELAQDGYIFESKKGRR